MEENEISVKIAFLGDPGVGKTCIANQYVKESFDENSISTSGANFISKKIIKNGTTYSLDIWDTAGQERYRSIGRHFYRGAYIICLVYDIQIETSFQRLKEVWYDDVKKYGEKCTLIAIIGNKCDMFLNEKVKEEEAREFAKSIGASFYLTSAKTGEGIKELFEDLFEKYLSPEFHQKIEEIQRNNTIAGSGQTSTIEISSKTINQEELSGAKKKKCCK